MSQDLDALGLLPAHAEIRVRFGDVDVTPASRGLRATTALNELPDAELVLDLEKLPAAPVDYFAPVTMGDSGTDARRTLFSGAVIEAQPEGEAARIRCLTGTAFKEHVVDAFVASNVSAPEVAHLMARGSGLGEDQMNIEGLDSLPWEVFEVVVPVHGVDLDQAHDIGSVRLLPAPLGERVLSQIDMPDDIRARFCDAPCHALALETESRIFQAREHGMDAIELALAWLTIRMRCGLARLPSGVVQSFARDQARAVPRSGEVVAVRGLFSHRHIVATPDALSSETAVGLDDSPLSPTDALARLSPPERQSLISCRRAATEAEPLARVYALWEAIEFYVGSWELGRNDTPLFTKQDLKGIREQISWLDPDQMKRLDQLLGGLNDQPLMQRLRSRIEAEGVLISEGEFALLHRLRKVRNSATHGRALMLPSPEDLDYATSIVSRMLLHTLERAAGRESAP